MHCGRSVRRSPATPDTKAGFDEPAFFIWRFATPTGSAEIFAASSAPAAGSSEESRRRNQKANYIGNLAMSREK